MNQQVRDENGSLISIRIVMAGKNHKLFDAAGQVRHV
jgi:hypothetical protein